MTAWQLFGQLGAKGIKLWVDEQGNLRFKAPKGAMTDPLKSAIKAHKAELIDLLERSKVQQGVTLTPVQRHPEEEYPLSFAQKRFWFLDRLAPGNPALHIPAAFEIRGNLNIRVLRDAFNTILARHESLRTFFVTNDRHEVLQKVATDVSLSLQQDYDLSHLESKTASQQIEQIIQEESLRPFNLAGNTPGHPDFLRVRLLKLADRDAAPCHLLIVNLHHIIADGWSSGLLIREVGEVYQSTLAQRPPALEDLKVQYIDYAHYQTRWMQTPAHDIQLAFWQDQLAQLPALDLPLDFPRPDQLPYHGRQVTRKLSQVTCDHLSGLQKSSGTTAFSLFLTAFKLLLMRYTGQQDFAVGIPTSGRRFPETLNVVGCFINLLSIRTPIDPETTLSNYLHQVQQTLLDAQDHQDIPFETVVDALSERNLSKHPVFQVLFTMDDLQLPANLLGDACQVTQVNTAAETAKYDLQLHVDQGDKPSVTLEYNSALFTHGHMEDMLKHFTLLLSNMSEEKRLIDIDIFDEQDYSELFSAMPPANEATRLLVERCEKLSLKKPGHIAVSQGTQSITFEELHQKANILAAILLEAGAKQNERVAICLPPGIESVIALLAVMKTAAAYVPLDVNYPQERLATILSIAKPEVLIGETPLAGLPATCRYLPLSEVNFDDDKVLIPEPRASFNAPFYTIFTSGSTGTPKGVSVSQANIFNLIHWYKNAYDFTSNDKFLVISALGFDLTQKNLLLPLLIGAEIVFPESTRYDPKVIRQTLYERDISVLNCVPSAFYPLLEPQETSQRFRDLSSLRLLLFGGEPIAIDTLTPWLDSPHCHAQIVNMYGPTECTDISTTFSPVSLADYKGKPLPIGKPIDGVATYILDAFMKPVPVGTKGELYIGGYSLSLGYLNREEKTAEVFVPNPFNTYQQPTLYRTGDAVRYERDSDGELQLVFQGRLDDQIKIHGFRIEPQDIAERIKAFEGITDAIITADSTFDREGLIAHYIADSRIDPAMLRHYLKIHLPDHMIPTAFVAVDTWPLSANGKIDKKALKKPAVDDFIRSEYVPPSSVPEKELAELFSKALNIPAVSVLDNFFELGGHSILATRLIGRIETTFGVTIKVQTFFENPTVRAIAQLIEAGIKDTHREALPPIPTLSASSRIPLSKMQERLWIIEQMTGNQSPYLIPFAIDIKGPLNPKAFIQGLQFVTERHESLRTTIRTLEDGSVCQEVLPMDAVLFGQRFQDTKEELNASLHTYAKAPFRFGEEPLFRAELITLSDNHHIFSAVMHHLITDGWSMGILQQDLFTAYTAFNAGQPLLLEPLPVQYRDFSAFQKAQLRNDSLQAHLDYWINQLKGAPERITLPTDKPRPVEQTSHGARTTLPVPDTLQGQLSVFCRQQGISLYHGLLSVFFVLLRHYAKQTDICVGTPVSGRERPELQNLIGYFVNAVVIRNDLSGKPDFVELTGRTFDRCSAALAHQDIPIEQVLEQLPLKRNISYSPVAQVGFNFIGRGLFSQATPEGLTTTVIDFPNSQAKYDLTLNVIENDEGLQLACEYNTDLFEAGTIDKLLGNFNTLLGLCLKSPEQPVDCHDISDKQALIAGYDPAIKADSILPLNAMQLDMVMGQAMQPEARANTLGYHIETAAPISESLWQQAINIATTGLSRLKTRLIDNNQPVGDFAYQAEAPQQEQPLHILDLSDKPLSEKEKQACMADFVYQPAAYLEGVFFRYGLIKLQGNKTLLLMSCHHAILDGISVAHVAQMHIDIYHALLKGEKPNVEDNFPYSQYIHENRAKTDRKATLDYWQAHLDVCEPLNFKVTGKTPSSERHQVDTLDFTREEWQSLLSFCRKNKTTPAIYLKVLYSLLITTYCQAETRYYITEFHANRDKNNRHAPGCFFGQSPFIVDPLLPTLAAHLQAAAALQKKSKPYLAISKGAIQALNPQGRLQFMYNYYHFLPESFDIEGCVSPCGEMPPFVEGAVQFIVKAQESKTSLELYYQPQLFDSLDFLSRLKRIHTQFLEGVTRIDKLKLLAHPEFMDQQFHWQNRQETVAETATHLTEWLEEQVKLSGNRTAIRVGEQTISYNSLHARANRLSHYLKEAGVGTDCRVAIYAEPSIELMVSILATLKAGGAYVPIDTRQPAARVQYMVSTAGCTLLIAPENLATEATFDIPCLALESLDAYGKHLPDTAPVLKGSKDDLIYVMFTSGSTGLPKGAAVTHEGVINLQRWYTRSVQAGPESRFLVISSPGFDLTQKNLFSPLITGGELIFEEHTSYNSQSIRDTLSTCKATIINCAPSLFYPLIEDHPGTEPLASLRHVIFGGESVALERLSPWIDSDHCKAQMTNHYGPTECTDISAFFPILEPHQYYNTTPPIGRANPGVSLHILDTRNRLLPRGVTGEIAVGGKGVGRGYLNNDTLNNSRFIPNPFGDGQLYLTGDLGYWREDGEMVFAGRKDDQIKLNGQRMEPAEIEYHLKQFDHVDDARVLPVDGQLTGYLLMQKDKTPPQAIQETLGKVLPAYMIPREIITLNAWPLNPNGKLNKKALPKGRQSDATFVAPRNPTEARIAAIIAEIVNEEKISVTADFFALGMNSLSASRAIVQLRQQFDLDIPLHLLLDLTTTEKLAAFIQVAEAKPEAPDNTPRETGTI